MTVRSAFLPLHFWGCFLIFFLISGEVSAQIPSHWYLNQEGGLPTNTVYKILQDRNNVTWITTSSGIVKYNSIQFTNYDNDTLRDKEFITINLDSLNRIWVTNTSKQIAYIEGGQLNMFNYNPSIKNINQINLEFDEDFLYLTIIYLKKEKKRRPANYSILYKIPIHEVSNNIPLKQYLVQSVKDTLIRPTVLSGDIIQLTGTKGHYQFTPFQSDNIGFSIPEKVEKTIQNWDNNHIQFKSLSEGTYTIFGEEKIVFWNSNGEVTLQKTQNTIHDITKVDDKLWILTASGLYFLDLTNNTISDPPLFAETAFSSMIKDREHNIWLGTLDQGIMMIPSVDFQIMTCNKSPFFSLFTLPDGTGILAGGKNKLLLIKKDNSVTNIQIPHNVGRILSIYAKEGTIVFAADNGAYWRDNSQNKFMLIPKSKASKAVLIDHRFGLWVGRYNRLTYYKKNSQKDTTYYVLQKRTIALAEDFEHQIWAGTTQEINTIKFDGNVFRSKKDTLPLFVNDIKVFNADTIYLATCNAGILQYNALGEKIQSLALSYQDCYNSLLCDKKAVWIGGNKGIIYYDTWQNRQIRISHYNGLPANEINALTSLDNTIWAATSKGLIKFSKDVINQPKPPTDIHINKIEINNSSIPLSNKTVNFTSSQNNLKITLDAINYSLRGDLQFKYRLLPDTQWQTTKLPIISFTNLKPGEYKFDALLKNDVPIGPPPSFSFRIKNPWWQKSWVQFIFVGLAILGTYLIVTFFQKNKFRKIKKDKEVQEKIATLKITALQAQMNPHFIFNALNTIQSFIYDNRQDLATKTLGKFSKLIRKVFEYSDYKVISLDHEIDFLKTYIDLEKLRFDQYLTVQLTCSDYVQSHSFALSIPPLLVQPIIENAFAHGLLHQDGEKKLNIHFEVIDNFLKCSVIDNGIGIEQSAKFNLETNQKRNISGLQLTEDRISVFNRASNPQGKQKSFIITDLKKATNGRESGTKVEIFIAIDYGE